MMAVCMVFIKPHPQVTCAARVRYHSLRARVRACVRTLLIRTVQYRSCYQKSYAIGRRYHVVWLARAARVQ